ARGRKVGGYGMSETPPAGACRGLEERAWPVRVDRRRRVGSGQRHPRGADAPDKARRSRRTRCYGWLQVGGQWITYHRYNIGGKVINIGTYFDRRGVIRSGFEDR